MSKLVRGIMLEGISCAGKTSTMYAIKKLFAADMNLERNTIMLGEHYTQVLNSVNGELKYHGQSEHTEMFYERVEMIERLHKWACYLGDSGRRSRGLYTVFERGLLNHMAFYGDYDDPKIKELERRFANLEIQEILLVVSDNMIEKRIKLRAEQMKECHSETYYEELTESYKLQQDKILDTAKRMALPCRIICTDSMKWEDFAYAIVYGNAAG